MPNTERQRVTIKKEFGPIFCDGSIDELHDLIHSLLCESDSLDGSVEIHYDSKENNPVIALYGKRFETNQEMEDRIKKEKIDEEDKEKQERQTLAYLKSKYGE